MNCSEPKKPDPSHESVRDQIADFEKVIVVEAFWAVCDTHRRWCMVVVMIRSIDGKLYVEHYEEG